MVVKRVGQDQGRVVVLFVTGGGFQAAVPASLADVCVVVDSRDELLKVPDLGNVIKIPLGDHETVLTLLERARALDAEAAELYTEYQKLPNVYLSAGMAQDPRLGACAMRDLAQSGQLHQYFADILVRVLEAANGQLSVVVIREANSQAGGMGSAGGPEIGARFRAFLETCTSAQLSLHMLRLGGLTYVSVAKRATSNTGYATKRNLDTLFATAAPRVTRDAEFAELPLRSEDNLPIRDKRALRDALAAPLLVARCSEAVVRLVDEREVNHKPESPFGEIRTIRAQWSDGLDQDELLRAAATAHRASIADLRRECDVPDSTIVQGVHVDVTPLETLPSIEEVTTAIRRGEVRGPLFDRLVDAGIPVFRATVFADITKDQAFTVDEVIHGLDAPKTLADVRSGIRRLRGVLSHLEKAQQEAGERHRFAEAARDKGKATMAAALRRLRSPMRTVEAVLSPKASLKRATAAFASYLGALEQVGQAAARVEALDSVIARFRTELAAYEDVWIGTADRALEGFLGNRPLHSAAIDVSPLGDVYPKLAETVARMSDASSSGKRALNAVLLQSVRYVTLAGLADMLGTTATAEDIVSALDREQYRWKAPMWGGGSRTGSVVPRERFVVLPPVSDNDLMALQAVANRRGFAPAVVAADTVAAGCRIVALDFYPVTGRADVETAIYTHAPSSTAATQHVM